MARNSIHSALCASLWLQVSGKHLDQEQKEHQTNDAKDNDEDDDGDGHEHVNSGPKVGNAVFHLLIFLVTTTVDLPVAEQLPPAHTYICVCVIKISILLPARRYPTQSNPIQSTYSLRCYIRL